MEMIKDPQEFIKSIKENNPNLTKEQIKYYKKSYIENYQDIKEGDIIETYDLNEVKR